MKNKTTHTFLETTWSDLKYYLFSKKIISELDLRKSDSKTQFRQQGRFNKIEQNSLRLFSLLLAFLSSFASFSQELPTTSANPPTVWGVNNLNLIESTNSGFITHVEDPFGNGVVDNQFTQGSKDFFEAEDLRWVIGQTKAKNDIANGAAILVGTTLFFAGDRTSTNGDAQIGFWFYKNDTSPRTRADGTRDFAPNHEEGDVLVLANFTNGGVTATVSVYIWKASGGNVPNTNGHLQTLPAAGAARLNQSAYDVPQGWQIINPGPSPSYQKNQFYEGYVNLADLGDGLCFSTFLLEARSSQSVTASLDDFTGGDFNVSPRVVTTPIEACDGEFLNNSFNLNDRINTSESTPNLTFTFYENTIVNSADTPNLTKPITTPFIAPIGTTKIWALGESNVLTGCTGQALFTIKVNQNPEPSVANQSACVGGTATFSTDELSGFSYEWRLEGSNTIIGTNHNYTTSTLVLGDSGKKYNVTVTKTGTTCTESASGTLTVNPNPEAEAGDPQAECPQADGNDFTLNGTATNGTVKWTVQSKTGTAEGSIPIGNDTLEDPTVHVTGVGTVTFLMTVTSASCGNDTDTVTVTVNPGAVTPSLKITDPQLCGTNPNSGSIQVCSPVAGTKYTLNTVPPTVIVAVAGSSVIFNNLGAGINPTIAVETGNGCTASANCNNRILGDCPTPLAAKIAAPTSTKEEIKSDAEKVGFTVFPVPFKDQLTVRYNFDYASQVLIEIFNSQGNKILSKKDYTSNKEIQLNLNRKTGQNEVYFVKVTTDRESSVQKVISSR